MEQRLHRSALVAVAEVLVLLAIPLTASGQLIIVDTNGDGKCGYSEMWDFVESPLDTVEVWLDTNHDKDGNPVVCPTGEELTISAYEIILATWSYRDGPVTYGTWINLMPEFTVDLGTAQTTGSGGAYYIAASFSSSGGTTHLPAGRYLLGEVTVQTIPGHCNLAIPAPGPLTIGTRTFESSFYSLCPGSGGVNLVRFGIDFVDACSAGSICDGVEDTTWGKIKQQYR